MTATPQRSFSWAWSGRHCGLMLGLLLLLSATAVRAQDLPFTAVVVGDEIAARAGAGKTYYVVGTLTQGTTVEVKDLVFGWHKIVPVKGMYSYVAKDAITADAGGATGTVSAARATLTAGGLNGPGESTEEQLKLPQGTQVALLGVEGGYYKVAPPQGVFVYLPPGSVRRTDLTAVASPAPPAAAVAPSADADVTPAVAQAAPAEDAHVPPGEETPAVAQAATQPADNAATDAPAAEDGTAQAVAADAADDDATAADADVAPAPAVAAAPVLDFKLPDPDQKFEFQPVTPSLIAAEASFKQAGELPVDKRPLDELLAQYQTVEKDPSLAQVERWVVRTRINQLQRSAQVAQVLRDLAAARVNSTATTMPATPAAKADEQADFMGTLQASAVYDGGRLPRLYRLVDSQRNVIVGYVRAAPGQDAPGLLGQQVGVYGEVQYDRALKLRVIEARKIVSWPPAGPAGAVAAPVDVATDH